VLEINNEKRSSANQRGGDDKLINFGVTESGVLGGAHNMADMKIGKSRIRS